MKIKIAADSTCDIGPELIAKHDIAILPVKVILGTREYSDGIDITPNDIFEYVNENKELPKTAAISEEGFIDFFKKYVDDGYKVLYFSISTKASSLYENAKKAQQRMGDDVYVIDTKALSSGEALLILHAIDLMDEGVGFEELIAKLEVAKEKINTSFVPDVLNYLYMGGRCSKMTMHAAKILNIHPKIEMLNGVLQATKKYLGTLGMALKSYIKDLSQQYPNYNKKRCFITHSSADKKYIDVVINKTKELFGFEEIIETVAGSVITGHCGKNTIGLLFMYD